MGTVVFELSPFLFVFSHAVNWETVKAVWEVNYISSAREFSHLLSVFSV